MKFGFHVIFIIFYQNLKYMLMSYNIYYVK